VPTPSDIERAIDLLGRIRSAAKSLAKLGTGDIFAFTGGAIVVGVVAGGILWMPAAMSGALLLYRAGRFFLERKDEQRAKRLQAWDEILLRREALHKSALPEKEREMMSQALDREVEMLTPKTRPLLPPEDMVEK